MARPPGNWDQLKSVPLFDLDDSRATGWRLDIEFERADPTDHSTGISFTLEGFSVPDYLKREGDLDTLYRVHTGSRAFGSIVGVLSDPETPIDQVSKQIRPGTFLVMGTRDGTPMRVFHVPIRSVQTSFTDFGQ